MKQSFLFFSLLILSITGIYYFSTDKEVTKNSKAQNIEAALKQNFELTKDPALGYPPTERLLKAVAQTRVLQKEFSLQKGKLNQARFRERGPDNIGGRTRAILIDAKDPSRNTIWAGGVSGGLWKTNDITATDPNWQKVNDFLENLAVGALAQDPNDPDLMFIGTGEGFPNIDAVAGVGILRSLDNGKNWELLPTTANNLDFRLTRKMIVHPSGDVYAGTSRGLFRSTDRGDNWDKVSGTGVFSSDNIYDLFYIPTDDYIYVSSLNTIYKSQTGDPRDWVSLATPTNQFPRGFTRIEFTVSLSDPNVIYLVGNDGGSSSNIFRTIDGAENWTDMGPVREDGDFTNGQVWYDLEIAVDPFDPNHVIAGGVPIYRTLNGAESWDRFAFNMHVDQHLTVFDETQQGVVYFGNDGGVYRSENGSADNVQDRNQGYNVTQFYAGAFHPDTFSNYILGGTQDNNSLQMNDKGITSARPVLGGDGMVCHIDQNEPNNQVVSYQFGNYFLSTDGGKTFNEGASVGGKFVNPSDYDDEANILYAQTSRGDFARWNIAGSTVINANIKNIDLDVTFVYADPSTSNRIYLGSANLGLYRVDNAHAGVLVIGKKMNLTTQGSISSVDVNPNDPNHILVTMSNYGLRNNVWESKNGGNSFTGIEGNLPDMPVRSVLLNPENPEQALIATEAGVWLTERINGDSTIWIPPALERGTPIVRTDWLQYRSSDKQILAATHGRGMFVSDVFSTPKALLDLDRIGYLDTPVDFFGDGSLGADSFLWTFGDGEQDTTENASHAYSQIGEYDVELTINNDVSENSIVKILPNKSLPYTPESNIYSGGFENNPEDYGVYTISGSTFELGVSTLLGKDGTHTGTNAFVLGKDEQFYQPNTHTMLYLPNFDFSEKSIYEFSFWSKQFLQDGFDGFLVEYSKDRGETWSVLGEKQENWYDYTNDNLENAAFPSSTSYFGRSSTEFEEHYIDLTEFSGEKDIAFRFIFRSNDTGSHPGLVIDDVEIRKYKGELQTAIVNLSADYSSSEKVTVSWTTQPEYFAQQFIVERSFNGKDFEEIEKLPATGATSGRLERYSIQTLGIRDLYFYRIRSINENKEGDYFYEFVTPAVVVRRSQNDVDLYRSYPNPFNRFVDLTFDNFVNQEVQIELFDATGRLVYENQKVITDAYLRVQTENLSSGVYFLRYKIGTQDFKTVKLVKGGF